MTEWIRTNEFRWLARIPCRVLQQKWERTINERYTEHEWRDIETVEGGGRSMIDSDKITIMDLENTVRLQTIDLANAHVALYKAERDKAGLNLQLAQLQLLLTVRENITGVKQMPLHASAAKRFFERQEGETK